MLGFGVLGLGRGYGLGLGCLRVLGLRVSGFGVLGLYDFRVGV